MCVGGYNSNWNRHEPVLQEDAASAAKRAANIGPSDSESPAQDAMGCEDTAEVVCSLTGLVNSQSQVFVFP